MDYGDWVFMIKVMSKTWNQTAWNSSW